MKAKDGIEELRAFMKAWAPQMAQTNVLVVHGLDRPLLAPYLIFIDEKGGTRLKVFLSLGKFHAIWWDSLSVYAQPKATAESSNLDTLMANIKWAAQRSS
jgi:hypothetical protein